MNLEILSLDNALKYLPKEETYAIRISSSLQRIPTINLIESDKWVKIREYCFDDLWPKEWKEYSWLNIHSPDFKKIFKTSWEEIKKSSPKITEESLISFLESQGQTWDRHILFNEAHAKKILNDYEEFGKNADNVLIHCYYGKNRSPAIGIAMNEIYGWKLKGLKKEFPNHRKYIYHTLKEATNLLI